ncbi:MAG TPA: trypsin-like peptidase domain-containing protein [Vicinamibacterales bacterium]|jgi:serine protease Do|nr:trypsin-like peptidase domain-containing protein [Vicinamibacterales bacterium]
MPRRFVFILLMLACFTAGVLLASRYREATDAGAQTQTPARPTVTTPVTVAGATALTDFSKIAERTIPAVVNVSAQQVVRRRVVDPFFSFFGGPDDLYGTRRGVENSLGSGVIVSSDGYILTNNHVVVGEAREQRAVTIEQLDVTVTLADKRELHAQPVGVDPATDLALLKIEARNLPTMPWGDSSKLKVAEWVLAIGNPYQLNQTVTLGIVSAVGRTNLGVNAYEDFVQTDAAINPGNSGGALVNARGELVGINTVIFSQSGGYQGIGFAVSSNLAKRIFTDLQQYQEVRRGSIGYFDGEQLTTRAANALGLSDTKGVYLSRMSRNSSAYRSGIQPGDVIVTFNGTAVEDPSHLNRLVSDAKIGSTAVVGVYREGRRVEVKVPITMPQTR